MTEKLRVIEAKQGINPHELARRLLAIACDYFDVHGRVEFPAQLVPEVSLMAVAEERAQYIARPKLSKSHAAKTPPKHSGSASPLSGDGVG